ncbi:hypothetical protein QTP86_025543 [Hemibagrus guttatus]|nr:hypothetical protein QTP86_025543 [Hemibagrus guttatus]
MELADVLTSIFNLSLSQITVPTCFKTTATVPLPKKNHPTCLNDNRPVALTPIIMKCFERVVLAHKDDNIIRKFADDTAGRITGADKAAYRKEVASLVTWCEDNYFTLNTDKIKEMIVDMRKERRTHQLLFI